MKRCLPLAWSLAVLPVVGTEAQIVIDYGNDAFFNADTEVSRLAREAVEQAAADLNAYIDFDLAPIGRDTFSGTVAGSNVTFTGSIASTPQFTTDGGDPVFVEVPLSEIGRNELRIFVSGDVLPFGTLGIGGPAQFRFTNRWTEDDTPGAFDAAFDAAVTDFNTALSRGGSGPTIFSVERSLADRPQSVYPLSAGPLGGNIRINLDAGGDGEISGDSELRNYFSFDANAPVEPGTVDFYTNALHEMIHTLGFGNAVTWFDQIDGNDWTGENVVALLGQDNNLIRRSDQNHIRSNASSFIVGTDILQEVVMDPTQSFNERKLLTELDLAFIADLGYAVRGVNTPIPEPATAGVLGLSAGVLLLGRRRRHAATVRA